ncbi:hypothetical protein J3A83DRAFT_4189826 [Scleroderma citrinum]
MATPIYTPTNYELSEKVVPYICKHFGYEAFPGTSLAPAPCLDLPIHASVGMDQMVSTLVQAYCNPIQSGIDLGQLSQSLGPMESGLDVNREALLLSRHPSSVIGYLDMLAIILGKEDTISLWYLPGSLAWPMQLIIWQTWEDDPAISSALATNASRQWLPDICLPAGILSGALSIMHPPLYDAGLEPTIQHLCIMTHIPVWTGTILSALVNTWIVYWTFQLLASNLTTVLAL